MTALAETLRTLPDHARCDTHQHYLLSCEDYEGLLDESGGGCFICGFLAADMPQRKLCIDHDYRGDWAVRGLLCISCNSGLGSYHHPTPAGAAEYLANARFLRKAADLGLTLREPEPPIGSVVRDHRGVLWTRARSGLWWPDRGNRQHRRSDVMERRCGRLKMHVIDFREDIALAEQGAA